MSPLSSDSFRRFLTATATTTLTTTFSLSCMKIFARKQQKITLSLYFQKIKRLLWLNPNANRPSNDRIVAKKNAFWFWRYFFVLDLNSKSLRLIPSFVVYVCACIFASYYIISRDVHVIESCNQSKMNDHSMRKAFFSIHSFTVDLFSKIIFPMRRNSFGTEMSFDYDKNPEKKKSTSEFDEHIHDSVYKNHYQEIPSAVIWFGLVFFSISEWNNVITSFDS